VGGVTGASASRAPGRARSIARPSQRLAREGPRKQVTAGGILFVTCRACARAGTTLIGSPVPRCRTPPRARPGRPPAPGSPGGRAVAQHCLRPLPCAYANRRTGRRKSAAGGSSAFMQARRLMPLAPTN